MIPLKDKKILIVSSHPDDEAICSGGLIMKGAREKAKVFVLYMAVGFSRQFLTGQTNAIERKKEMKKASSYGKFGYYLVFEGDDFMRLDKLPQKNLIEQIEDASQKFEPDIVVLPFRHSFDQDHRAVASACITAFRPLPEDIRHQPKIILEAEEPYSWNNGCPFDPNFYVDISGLLDKKIKLLEKHKTQLRPDPFPRSPENLKRLAGLRGAEVGVKYAEAYRLLRGKIL